MNDNGSKFYFSRLTDAEKQIYDRICEALLRFEPTLSVQTGMGKAFPIDTKKILMAVLFDNPVFFYLNRERVIVKQTPFYLQLVFQYDYPREEAEALWAQVEHRVDLFMQNHIKPDMRALAKQLQVHNSLYTVHAAQPPYDKDCLSVVGAFLRNRCVCEGFANAYKLLCDRLGIASIIVTGEALLGNGQREAHSWNITRINGVTAHTDTAWDACLGGAAYDYFNLCDADIAADHVFDSTLYPKCWPNQINYFYKNGLLAANEKALHQCISAHSDKPYFSVKLLFPFSERQAQALPFDIGTIRYNPAQNVIGYNKAMIE